MTPIDEEALKSELVRRAVESSAFRAALLADPKGAIERELGRPLPDSLAVEVVQESSRRMYLVLPLAVQEAELAGNTHASSELDDSALDQVTGGAAKPVKDFRHDGPLNRSLSGRP